MFDIIRDKIKEILGSRIFYVSVVFVLLFSILVGRMYSLQVLNGGTVAGNDKSAYRSEQSRYINATRGNIYDRNGNLLAYNVLSYSVVMTNSALLKTNKQKNDMLLKLIEIVEGNGYTIELDFPIVHNEETDTLEFTVSGNAELRFKKNAYCLTSVSKLSEEQKASTAQEVYDFLKAGDGTTSMFGINDDLPIETALKVMSLRYTLFTLYPQYSQFTICTNVDEVTIAAIEENSDILLGVEVQQQTSRVYNDAIYFAHILGYTGNANEDEAESLNEGLETVMYSTADVVGKAGIEKGCDEILRGTKGIQKLTVNSLGRIVEAENIEEPTAGNDIYLTIDRELQIACYHILENNIAAILMSKIVDSNSYGGKGESANKITIPIYEVYNAFIANGIIDISRFRSEDATELESSVYKTFLNKRESTLANLRTVLAYDSKRANKDLSDEMEGYIDFIYSMLGDNGIVMRSSIDSSDKTYKEYVDDKISLAELLRYEITNYYVDLSKLGIGSEYYSVEEIYGILMDYIFDKLMDNDNFERMLYKQLIFNKNISGRTICQLLYQQGVLEYNENDYNKLKNGRISAYNFIMDKLLTLEITPAMLALEPCSGSIVITDVNTGDVLAQVSYPSYDINKLANKIDYNYYQSLLSNKATPMFNRATSQMTATGSTFKPLMALAGLGEGIITTSTKIKDEGVFEEIVPSPKCWKYPSNHGSINLTQAIQHSCNYFFYKIGYEMSLDSAGNTSDSLGISKIQKYASMFGLSTKSGEELPEAQPAISSTDCVRTAIGYYHSFAPVQIARYVTALANRGTVYNLTLVDKIVSKDENVVVDNSATVYNKIEIYTKNQWDAVQKGMYDVVNTSANSLDKLYGDLGFKVAGKTGTAQVSLTHPSHGLFVSFAPYSNPEIAVTVVLPNGYASANAAKLAREVYGLYFNEENKEALLSGDLTTTTVTSIHVSD